MSEISKTASKLYRAAEELRDVRGPSAVARLLGVSPQVIKNWELREVSEGGALLAQRHIGCDANWILGHQDQMQKTTRIVKPAMNIAREDGAEYSVTPASWPFLTISLGEWAALDDGQKATAESILKSFINGASVTPNQTKRPAA
jgi:hypothetical protein